jgi:hypothetical protein
MWPRGFVLLILAGAGLAACSGSLGSSGAMPAALSSPNFGGNPTPAPSPSAASAVLTYGDNANFQELPEVGGFGGAIAFPTAGPATPAPANSKAKGSPTPAPAPTAVEIAMGVTLSIHKPEDGPDLNLAGGKGHKHKGREHPARALCYIEILPTHDATLTEYPRVAVDIPREIATEYRDGEFGIALWNSGEKDSVYHLHVANLDTTAPPPPSAHVSEHSPVTHESPTGSNTAPPTPASAVTPPPGVFTPTPTPTPTRMPNGQMPTNAPSGGPGHGLAHASAEPTLPPQRILFASTQIPLHLVANRPAIFAVYALPQQTDASPTPLPSPSRKPGAAAVTKTSGSPAPRENGTPAATTIQTSASPEATTATTGAPAAAGTPQPAKSP